MAKEEFFGHVLIIIFYKSPLESFLGIFFGKATMLPLSPLWFLPCLLLTEIIFIQIYNRLKNFPKLFVATIFFVTCGGFVLSRLGYLLLGLNVAFVAQIFLLAGILIRRYSVVERLSPKICGGLTLILIAAFEFNEAVNMSGANYGEPILFYAGGLAGSLLLMKISALMSAGKIFSLISSCGRQSMMILVLHPLIIELLYNLLVRAANFPLEKIFSAPIIFCAAFSGTLLPLWIAERFGKLPVLKKFCS